MSRRKETRLLGPLINHNNCKFKISVCKCGMTQFVCLLEWITSTTPWSTLCSLLRRNRGFTGCISSASTPRVYESLANISTVCQGPVTVTGLNKPCEWIIQRGPEWMIEQEERIITSFPGYQLFRLHYDPASPPECLSRGVGSLTLQRWSDVEEGQLPSKEKAE